MKEDILIRELSLSRFLFHATGIRELNQKTGICFARISCFLTNILQRLSELQAESLFIQYSYIYKTDLRSTQDQSQPSRHFLAGTESGQAFLQTGLTDGQWQLIPHTRTASQHQYMVSQKNKKKVSEIFRYQGSVPKKTVIFGNFSQKGGGGHPNSQNFCKITMSFLACQIHPKVLKLVLQR